MKKLVSLLLAFFVILSIGSLAFASDVSDANYYGVIRATNSGTATSNVCANVSINTTALIASGFLDETSTNAAVRVSSTDVPFMPGNDGDPWIVHYDSIGQNSNSDVTLYTGNVTGGKIVFFPDAGSDGLTIPYDPSLALGNEFEITINNLLLNTSSPDPVIIKNESYNVTGDGDGTYTAILSDAGQPVIESSNSSVQNVSSVNHLIGLPAGIESGDLLIINIAEYTGGGGGVTFTCAGWTQLFTELSSYAKLHTFYKIANGSEGQTVTFTCSNSIYSAHTSYRISNYSGIPVYNKANGNSTTPNPPSLTVPGSAALWLVACATYQFQINAYPANYIDNQRSAIHTGTWAASISSAGRYLIAETEDPGTFTVPNTYWAAATIAISGTSPSVSVSGITDAEYSDLSLSINSTSLTLTIGTTTNTTPVTGVSVINNSNDLIFFQNGSTLYAENITVSINGSPVSAWNWELCNTFHDLIGSNDGTPVFRTDSSDPDVSAELLNYKLVAKSTVDDDTALVWPEIMEDPPDLPETMYTDNTTPGFFFAGIVHTIAEFSEVPEALFWYNFAFTIIIIIGILVYYAAESAKSSSNGTSSKLFLKILIQGTFLCIFALPGLNIYGFFVPLYYIFFSSGVFMLAKDFGW